MTEREEYLYGIGRSDLVRDERVFYGTLDGFVSHDDTEFMRNGLEEDREIFAPTVEFEVSPDAYDEREVEAAIGWMVDVDIQELGEAQLLDPIFAAQRALEAHSHIASDINYPLEKTVAEYFAHLADRLQSMDRPDLTRDHIVSLINGVEDLLRAMDEARVMNEGLKQAA